MNEDRERNGKEDGKFDDIVGLIEKCDNIECCLASILTHSANRSQPSVGKQGNYTSSNLAYKSNTYVGLSLNHNNYTLF